MRYSTLEGAILQTYAHNEYFKNKEKDKMFYYSNNLSEDIAAHDRDEDRWLSKHPVCACCEERITDEYLYLINGEKFCEACLNRQYRENTDNYMEE